MFSTKVLFDHALVVGTQELFDTASTMAFFDDALPVVGTQELFDTASTRSSSPCSAPT